jgi:hypothetical protein
LNVTTTAERGLKDRVPKYSLTDLINDLSCCRAAFGFAFRVRTVIRAGGTSGDLALKVDTAIQFALPEFENRIWESSNLDVITRALFGW